MLDSFKRAKVKRIEAVHTLSGRQEIMRTLYDHFFSQAFPRMSERLDIVFTPSRSRTSSSAARTTRCARPLARAWAIRAWLSSSQGRRV